MSPYRLAATKHPYHLVPLALSLLWCLACLFTGDMSAEAIGTVLTAEVLYQIFAPDWAFFVDLVDQETNHRKVEAALEAKQNAKFAITDYGLQTRYLRMVEQEQAIKLHLANQPPEIAALLDTASVASNLVRNFLRVAVSLSGIQKFLSQADPRKIEAVLDELEGRQQPLEDGSYQFPEGLRELEAKRISVLSARLDKIAAVEVRKPELETQLAALEDTMQLMHDQLLAPTEGEKVRVDVEEILRSVNSNATSEVSTALMDAEDAEDEINSLREAIAKRR